MNSAKITVYKVDIFDTTPQKMEYLIESYPPHEIQTMYPTKTMATLVYLSLEVAKQVLNEVGTQYAEILERQINND